MAKKDRTEDLVKDLVHEEDWKRMNATAELLKRGPEAVRHLVDDGLSAEDSALRAETAKMLGRIKDRTAGEPIVLLLKDSDAKVREAAAEAIAHVADPAALEALVRLLEDELTRDTAAEVLGRLKDPGATEPLIAMMKSEKPVARRMAAEALEQLADPRSVDAWIGAMAHPDLQDIAARSLKRIADLRERITDILDRLRDIDDTVGLEEARIGVTMDLIALGRPAVPELLSALDDDVWVVREAAAQALGIIGDLRAVERLLAKAK
jgi:HEAT repeat protein